MKWDACEVVYGQVFKKGWDFEVESVKGVDRKPNKCAMDLKS